MVVFIMASLVSEVAKYKMLHVPLMLQLLWSQLLKILGLAKKPPD